MPRNCFSQIRRLSCRFDFRAAMLLLALVWLSHGFAAICAQPMVGHTSQQATACPLAMSVDEFSGPAASSPEDCAFKFCLEQTSDRWLWTAPGKVPTPMPWVLVLVSALFVLAVGSVGRVQQVEHHPEHVPLIYLFCSLLN